MEEGVPSSKGLFALRRITVPEPLDDFFFDPPYDHLVGSAREGKAVVVDLVIRRAVKQLEMPGLPHLGSGITWNWQGRPVTIARTDRTARPAAPATGAEQV